jgi:predicted nucleotidyltransferase component of viral defense system
VTPKNLAASVHARLAQIARRTNRPFQETLQYFAMERFLYRLCRSPYAERFVLKGALMLRVWDAPTARPTKDVDLLGRMANSLDNLASVVREICAVEVEPDGLMFQETTVRAERIKVDADYQGVRVRFLGMLGKAKIAMQLDVGFGDVVVPDPEEIDYPALLEFPAPRLKGYSRESVIAEKFEAMVKLGTLNSRMKDFYDIWLLSRQFDFDGATLTRALTATFAHRETALDPKPVALTPAFSESAVAETQWRAFVRKGKFAPAPEHLSETVAAVAEFLLPIARARHAGDAFVMMWTPSGPWRPRP